MDNSDECLNQNLVQRGAFSEDWMPMRSFMWYIIHNNSNVYIMYYIICM